MPKNKYNTEQQDNTRVYSNAWMRMPFRTDKEVEEQNLRNAQRRADESLGQLNPRGHVPKQLLEKYEADEKTRLFMAEKRKNLELADLIFGDAALSLVPVPGLNTFTRKAILFGGKLLSKAKSAAETVRYGKLGKPSVPEGFSTVLPKTEFHPSALAKNAVQTYDEIGGKSEIPFMFLSTIDHYRKGGLPSLMDGGVEAAEFKNFVGLSPEEFKQHWYKRFPSRMPAAARERVLSNVLNQELDRAQTNLNDILSAKNAALGRQLDERLKPARDAMIGLFDSEEYRSRWPAYSRKPDEFIKNISTAAGSVLKDNIISIPSNGLYTLYPQKVNAGGSYNIDNHFIQVREDLLNYFTPEHEFAHASDLGEDVDVIYSKLKPKKSPKVDYDYYDKSTEKRARVMAALADMRKRGYNINSYNDILDYLLFNNGFDNRNVKSIFDNYDFKIPDLLDIFRYGKALMPPVIGAGVGTKIYNSYNNE